MKYDTFSFVLVPTKVQGRSSVRAHTYAYASASASACDTAFALASAYV